MIHNEGGVQHMLPPKGKQATPATAAAGRAAGWLVGAVGALTPLVRRQPTRNDPTGQQEVAP
jgi:hypothetical protein